MFAFFYGNSYILNFCCSLEVINISTILARKDGLWQNCDIGQSKLCSSGTNVFFRAILSSDQLSEKPSPCPSLDRIFLPSPGNKLEVGSCGRLYYVPVRIQVSDKLYLWSGDYPGTSRVAQCNHGVGVMRKREAEGSEPERWHHEKNLTDVASLGNGERGALSQGTQSTSRSRKGKETESPLEVTKVMLTFWFDQWSPFGFLVSKLKDN